MPIEVKIKKEVAPGIYSAEGMYYPRKSLHKDQPDLPIKALVKVADGKAHLTLDSGLQETTIGGMACVALHFAEENAVPVEKGVKAGDVFTFERVIYNVDSKHLKKETAAIAEKKKTNKK